MDRARDYDASPLHSSLQLIPKLHAHDEQRDEVRCAKLLAGSDHHDRSTRPSNGAATNMSGYDCNSGVRSPERYDPRLLPTPVITGESHMRRTSLHAAALAAGLLAATGTAALAQGTTTAPGTTTTPATTTAADVDDDDGFDLGWLGLLGLAGLAGLTGRKRDTHVDVNRPRV